MENEDYLIQEQDKNVLKNLVKMGEHLKSLNSKMLAKEAEYIEAKKEYDYYANSVLPMEMFNAGVASLDLISGGRISYEHKYYCQPNKNADDKNVIAEWLRQHGGEHLIKDQAYVDGALIGKLKEIGIPYVEKDDINTNSLKAFIKDKLGEQGGTQQLTLDDIPACIHFQEVSTVRIDI
jgi:hypothetical protein